ncbi:MAG TPA: hypothetical protein VFT82_02260 [Candidatus Paceibacterota bacterium]|nr:hypothetical protein [Candidatus Paceibacterota bacterium]
MHTITKAQSARLTQLIRDPGFQLEVANLLKPADKRYGPNDLPQIALSQSRLYAVIAAAKALLTLGFAEKFEVALAMLIAGDCPEAVTLSNDIAHWTWASMQPILGGDRMTRPAFIETDELPSDEVEKDRVRIVATAELLLAALQSTA